MVGGRSPSGSRSFRPGTVPRPPPQTSGQYLAFFGITGKRRPLPGTNGSTAIASLAVKARTIGVSGTGVFGVRATHPPEAYSPNSSWPVNSQATADAGTSSAV